MLSVVGGVDAKTNIRRILNKLFTNKFAIECSWTGRAFEKDIKKYKIQDLQIIVVMRSELSVSLVLTQNSKLKQC